jgi:hypothetical protein
MLVMFFQPSYDPRVTEMAMPMEAQTRQRSVSCPTTALFKSTPLQTRKQIILVWAELPLLLSQLAVLQQVPG